MHLVLKRQTEKQLWVQFFSNPSVWWDDRASIVDHEPEFKHAFTGEALWTGSCPKAFHPKLQDLVNWPASQQRRRASYNVNVDLLVQLKPEHGKANPSLLEGLKECSSSRNLLKGRMLHAAALQNGDACNIYLASTLVNMYAKCGSMPDARRVFEEIRHPTVVSWNALLNGYAENGEGQVALELLSRMRSEGFWAPDALSYVAGIKACGSLAAQTQAGAKLKGKAIHVLAANSNLNSDPLVASSLIDMYAKCGSMNDALDVFEACCEPDVVLWNSLIFGYAENGEGAVALSMLSEMEADGCAPNERTFVAVLKACTDLASKEAWKQVAGKRVKSRSQEKAAAIHSQAVKCGYDTDAYVASTLIDLYAKCGSIRDAREVFEELDRPLVVSWTALILGYVDNGEAATALELFSRMKQEACQPNSTTFVAALKACGSLGALETGKVLHDDICALGFDSEIIVQNSLVDFYGKCGSMGDAQQVFHSLSGKSLISWTSLISGFSRHGDTEKVFELFDKMQEDASLRPDAPIFSCILTACSHTGLVDRGKEYFELMSSKFGLTPDIEHYQCMVDLLGRSNELEAAVELVKSMPYTPEAATWTSILGACQKWKNVELGKAAFQALLRLDQQDPAAYALMANIYGSAGLWEERSKVLALKRMHCRASSRRAQSWWSDEAGMVHSFTAGDSKAQAEFVREKLRQVYGRIKEHGGYAAETSSVARNISDPEKEDALCGHSEKLAIAFALLKTAPGAEIRIIKNLRICEDCHKFTALVSEVEQRTVVCRDASRFHVFKDGKCSCGNFW